MDGYEKAQHQAAGHDGALVDPSGALFIKPTTQQEIDFYTEVLSKENELPQQDDEKDASESRLVDWIPVYVGTLEQGISEKAKETNQVTGDLKELDSKQVKKDDKKYLVLKNLLHGFKKPSIIDIKIGTILHDDNASPEKIAKLGEVTKTTTSGSLGFRVCGMKLFHPDVPDLNPYHDEASTQVTKDEDGYLTFDKWFGRALTKDNITEFFKLFFNHNHLNKEQKDIIIRNTFTRVQLLYNCLIESEVTIRSGSLFIAYENDLQRWDNVNNEDPIFKDDFPFDEDDDDEDDDENDYDDVPAPLSLASLIDFAHAKFTPGKTDENLLQGIENLIESLEKLLDE